MNPMNPVDSSVVSIQTLSTLPKVTPKMFAGNEVVSSGGKISLILKPGGVFIQKDRDGKGIKQTSKNINIFELRLQYMFGTLSVKFKRTWSIRVDRLVL